MIKDDLFHFTYHGRNLIMMQLNLKNNICAYIILIITCMPRQVNVNGDIAPHGNAI